MNNLKTSVDCIEDLEIYFNVEYFIENELNTDELIIGGSKIKVTKYNLDEYINKRIEYILNMHRPFINEMKNGLLSV